MRPHKEVLFMSRWEEEMSQPGCYADPDSYDSDDGRCMHCTWQDGCQQTIMQTQAALYHSMGQRPGMYQSNPNIYRPPVATIAYPTGAGAAQPMPAAPYPQVIPQAVPGTPAVQRQQPSYVVRDGQGPVVVNLGAQPTPCFSEAVGEMMSTGVSYMSRALADVFLPHAKHPVGAFGRGLFLSGSEYLNVRRWRPGDPQKWDPQKMRWVPLEE
jgi:hypothetical protein